MCSFWLAGLPILLPFPHTALTSSPLSNSVQVLLSWRGRALSLTSAAFPVSLFPNTHSLCGNYCLLLFSLEYWELFGDDGIITKRKIEVVFKFCCWDNNSHTYGQKWTFIEDLLWPRHWARCAISFNFHNGLGSWMVGRGYTKKSSFLLPAVFHCYSSGAGLTHHKWPAL